MWHPYIGAWAVAFTSETAILVVREINHHEAGYRTTQTALHSVRLICISLLLVTGLYYTLPESSTAKKLDEENEPLLAPQHVNAAKNTNAPPDYGSISASDDDEDDADGDVGSDDDDEPQRAKELRKQQRKRLRERGSWIAYLKDYKILVALVWPSDDRYVQGCLVVLVAVLLADRALNVLIPRQLGIITNQLASMADTGECFL